MIRPVWIIGATGRIGRAVAESLAARQVPLVLLGRNAATLSALAQATNAARTLVVRSLEDIVLAIGEGDAGVVVNTVGPFAQTALPIVKACPKRCHYVDISNELRALIEGLSWHHQAVAGAKCLVFGAGFGVYATESVVVKLCEGMGPAISVRVDAIPFINSPGLIGPTVAATVIDSFPAGGKHYARGRLTKAALGEKYEKFTLPDGSSAATGGVATGDLEAARRASLAPSVIAASSLSPSPVMAWTLLPLMALLLSSRTLRKFATRQLARVSVAPAQNPDSYSWARARIRWADGTVKEGWMRAGEGMAFTAAILSEVTYRLATDQGRPGAYTPGALFGTSLAEQVGANIMSQDSI